MIEVDLLPSELRPKRKISLTGMFNSRWLLKCLGYLFALHLALHVAIFINSKRLNFIERNWQNKSTERKEISQMKSELDQINKQIPLFEQIAGNRILWAKKLNQISDLMVSGIWLKEISIEKDQPGQKDKLVATPLYLIIQGCAASRTKEEPALIGRFMQNLKRNLNFSADFTEISLGPIKKRLVKQTEVMDFSLICQFKQERAQALLE